MATDDQPHRASIEQPACIWMQAGVVRQKNCQNDYECAPCSFDRSLKRVADENRRRRRQGNPLSGKREKIVYWKEKIAERPPAKRPCIHHMKGRIEYKSCHNEYRCGSCEFDQYFNDHYTIHAVVKPVDVLDVAGFKIPQGYYLHRGHTWVKVEEGSEVRIGMDDFALRLLGPLDRIEAPLIGKVVKQDQPDLKLHRSSHLASLLSPVSGVITATNPKLREPGGLPNQDPYAEGWIARIHPDNLRRDLRQLMFSRETENFLEQEVDHLYRLIEETTGPLAADGGYLGSDIYGNIPQIGWDRLTKTFLRT
jgi:glycine cleavage system H lipoate-binding protein